MLPARSNSARRNGLGRPRALAGGSDRLDGPGPVGADRSRRLHEAGDGAARRQLEKAAAVHPRRAGGIDVRGPGGFPIWGERRRIHLVHPRRLLRPQSAENQRRDHRRGRSPEVRGGLPAPGAGPGKRRAGGRPRPARTTHPPRRPPGHGVELAPRDIEGLIQQTRQPEFISSAYFLRFKFDAGQLRACRPRTARGSEVLRIEYYPTKLFSDDEDDRRAASGGRNGREPSANDKARGRHR